MHTAHKTHHHPHVAAVPKRSTHFSKTFRWQPAKPGDPQPGAVAVAGTFNEWRPAALHHDRATNFWQLALHHIPGNRTHHYMLLVDGQPVNDKHSDGLAKPETEAEKQFALHTARGPRVFILFSNTK